MLVEKGQVSRCWNPGQNKLSHDHRSAPASITSIRKEIETRLEHTILFFVEKKKTTKQNKIDIVNSFFYFIFIFFFPQYFLGVPHGLCQGVHISGLYLVLY
jgi:hypothetical protein